MDDWTTCRTCQRVVWVKDVNRDGMCVLCAPSPVAGDSVAPVAEPDPEPARHTLPTFLGMTVKVKE